MIDISIIIPSYNTKDLLLSCIDSIFKETKTPFEIIIVDNGSTDGTVEAAIGQYGEVIVIRNKQNLGFARAINQGLKKAQGKYILILNSDTVILDGAIDKEITFMQTHEEAGVVGCQLKNNDGSIQPSGGYLPNLWRVFLWMSFIDDIPFLKSIIRPYHVEDRSFYTHQRYLGWVTGAFFLISRKAFEKVGFFDEKMFMYVEEVDWCARAERYGFRVVFNPQASVVHYKGSSGEKNQAGKIEEYEGIKYFFGKNKPSWQTPFLRINLKIGSLLRMFLFGIIIKDSELQKIYAKAFRVA